MADRAFIPVRVIVTDIDILLVNNLVGSNAIIVVLATGTTLTLLVLSIVTARETSKFPV